MWPHLLLGRGPASFELRGAGARCVALGAVLVHGRVELLGRGGGRRRQQLQAAAGLLGRLVACLQQLRLLAESLQPSREVLHLALDGQQLQSIRERRLHALVGLGQGLELGLLVLGAGEVGLQLLGLVPVALVPLGHSVQLQLPVVQGVLLALAVLAQGGSRRRRR